MSVLMMIHNLSQNTFMAAVFLIAGTLLAGLPYASAQTVQQVAVLVNDEPISTYDIQQRTKLLQVSTRRPENAALRNEATEQLIDEMLKFQAARDMNISIPEDQVLTALSQLAGNSNMNLEQFAQALGQVGLSIRTLRARIEAELAWRDVVTARFRGTVRLSEQDVDAAITGETILESSTRTQYNLTQILFLVRPGATTSAIQARINEAKGVYSKLTTCGAVRSVTSGIRDVVVQDVGRRVSTDLPAEMNAALSGLQVGQATEPNSTDRGVEIVMVCGREDITDTTAARQEVQNQLANEEFAVVARRFLRDLRQDAVIERR
jgi:peptidyl-prolyl cis-trans isomerase SurA